MSSHLANALRLCAGLLLVCAVLLAHHGTTVSYDTSKTFTTQATVTEFRYANPHPQLFFDVKGELGDVVHWAGEIAPNPAQLVRAGWSRKRSEAALAPGASVTITLSPSRPGMSAHFGLILKIVNSAGELILGTILNPGSGEAQRR
jgi:hypothetical protein